MAPTSAQQIDSHIRSVAERSEARAEAPEAARDDAYAAASHEAAPSQDEREFETADAEFGADRRSRQLSGLGRAEDRLSNLFSKMSKGLGFGGDAQPIQPRTEQPQHLRWEQAGNAVGGDPVAEIPAFLRRDRSRS
ncbi:MAG TPA: hypothetical protein VHL31_12170 [Geminicoccus sp.]|jgi:hypothetical protein|uniref:hypothetical protein n=1 Tax=Geminicoccus sp. TaxID=2024832 RepID=UPI002E31A983|nr:hypothetical protein [Geminicoccus sp.]HEX2527036.1 hypothetical protein [Geminicoccus sp.]